LSLPKINWQADLTDLIKESAYGSSIPLLLILYHIRRETGNTSLPNDVLEFVIKTVIDQGYTFDGTVFKKSDEVTR